VAVIEVLLKDPHVDVALDDGDALRCGGHLVLGTLK